MRYQRCSIDDAQSYEMVIVLGLEQEEEEDRNIHFDKQTVNLANTKLVKIACAPEMQCSHYCHNNKEDESDHLVDGEYRHVKWHVQIEQW